jgi:hypothetical protein
MWEMGFTLLFPGGMFAPASCDACTGAASEPTCTRTLQASGCEHLGQDKGIIMLQFMWEYAVLIFAHVVFLPIITYPLPVAAGMFGLLGVTLWCAR